jgi:imidazolonepropionase-like amidohydrolase
MYTPNNHYSKDPFVLLYGGNVFTSLGDEVHEGWGVLVHERKIVAVGPLEEVERMDSNICKIDIGGRTVLPGLVDAHRHVIGQNSIEVTGKLIAEAAITGVRVAWETLENGITSVRDPGCKHHAIFILRDAINQGLIPGPRIFATGQNPTGHAAPKNWRNVYIEGPWGMRRSIRELVRDGADWIKIIVDGATEESDYKFHARFITNEEIQAAINEAHALGKKISCHVESLDAARFVVSAGIDAIEHGLYLDEELVNILVDKEIYYIPTLWVFHNAIERGEIPDQKKVAYGRVLTEHNKSFKMAFEAHVKIAVGTDSVEDIPPKDCYIDELEMMINNGMNNYEVLRAATRIGAEVIGKEDNIGALSPGLLADIIVVDGNPLKDIRSLEHVDLVLKGGEIFINKIT